MMSDTPTQKPILQAAAEELGGQTELARRLSAALEKPVSQQWVWNVINRNQVIPAEWCLPIEKATAGKFNRHDLRPDIYPIDRGEAA